VRGTAAFTLALVSADPEEDDWIAWRTGPRSSST
jgi:hypothetical protein